jgi:putative SOS response-associated peptidase YedK
MCGRFTLSKTPEDVAQHFQLDNVPSIEPRYNVAPTQQVFAVRSVGEGREGVLLKWGLVPSWASDPSIGVRMLNARAETIAAKPSFRTAFQRRRCLIASDGFYEWVSVGKQKQPIHFRKGDGRLFAFAGLWESWRAPNGVTLESCSIITTTANELVQPVHDRMPVILDPSSYAEWLDPKHTNAAALLPLLAPWRADEMAAIPANPFVNNARNEGPSCLSA